MFATLHDTGTEPVIKIAQNTVASSTRSPRRGQYRRRAVREYQAEGYTAWASRREYGSRWPGTEGIFSAGKRK